MNNKNTAGKAGKGFYAALSLSVAMVGAACWYAYAQTGRRTVSRTPAPAGEQTSAGTTVTSAQQTTTLTELWHTDLTFTETQPLLTTEPAEQAAALLTQASEETTETRTAATTARAELPTLPVEGICVNPYSAGELVKSGTTGIWQTHNGLDLAAPLGTEVCAVLDGTVTAVGHDVLWGVCVSVLHDDGTVTRYCGLNEALEVQAGQLLERGDVIGTIGATAEAEALSEPHLHFEVLRNDAFIDPEAFFAGAVPECTTAETGSSGV